MSGAPEPASIIRYGVPGTPEPGTQVWYPRNPNLASRGSARVASFGELPAWIIQSHGLSTQARYRCVPELPATVSMHDRSWRPGP